VYSGLFGKKNRIFWGEGRKRRGGEWQGKQKEQEKEKEEKEEEGGRRKKDVEEDTAPRY
jgi:hypothetical protein